jgi:hypothetical protein
MTGQIILQSKGENFICQYDPEDHELISQYTWNLHSQGYAVTTINGKRVLMHRLILGIIEHPDIEVDHIFHNKLDNRRSMIRICTRSENRRNSRKLTGVSKFKGVYRDGKYWHTQIMRDQKVINLGRYNSERTAGLVYDREAKKTFKDFAFLNFPDQMLPVQQKLFM